MSKESDVFFEAWALQINRRLELEKAAHESMLRREQWFREARAEQAERKVKS